MAKVDLHIHSTASDGRFSPEEIVQKAAALGLTVIALADHDSVDGVAPALAAAKAFSNLKVIPNVEISTDTPVGEVHILGYFVDHTDKELKVSLERFRDSRQIRARKMVAKLKGLGINIDWPRVQQIAGTGSIGRPHVAQAMLEKGYIATFRDAFDKYIGYGGPAYVEREKMTPEEAVALIARANGLSALAHPFTVDDPEVFITQLKPAGLTSIEAYYKDYNEQKRKTLVSIADKHSLIATGGSDYHGLDDNNEIMMGNAGVPEEVIEQLFALARQRGLKTISQ
ncbi:PHP domain-containing protein [Chloroflexota bacterium]